MAHQVDGKVVASGLMGDHSEQMQAVGVTGIGGQNLAEEMLCFLRVAGLVMPDRGSEQRLHGRGRRWHHGTGRLVVRPMLVAVHVCVA
jgi:hypothetical protein